MAKKKTARRGGFKLPGGIGPKAALFGALGLSIAPMLLPGQSGGVQKVAVGMGMRALKIGGGGALSAVGLMELVAQFIGPVIGGAGFPFGGGGNGRGGTDY